ncbi:hypothetical protein [Aquibacillus kalidii]|uniref:hypothetical protein n=1 Tax=Aquibacillus kalidii TaxID=2762597 RepID=UPI0016484310|nr:hypothetical protein [Aquibacillus kalidii]
MYLLLSIILSTILGLILFYMPAQAGSIITFGIVIGCLFRAVYLLHDIQKRIASKIPKKNILQETYENHQKKRDKDKNSYLS